MQLRCACLSICSLSLLACGDSSDVPKDIDDHPLGVVSLTASPAPSASLYATTTFLPGGSAFVCGAPPPSVGNCTVYLCTPRAVGSPPAVQPNAGVVSVDGGAMPLVFSPGSDGWYDPIQKATAVFVGGETLTASAVGTADVPAFVAKTKAPKVATISAPALPSGDWVVDRTTPIELTWSGLSSAERVSVTFGANTTNPNEIECLFDGDAGSGTVPAEALAHLPAGDGYFQILSRTQAVVADKPWNVRFTANMQAVDATGATFTGGAQIK